MVIAIKNEKLTTISSQDCGSTTQGAISLATSLHLDKTSGEETLEFRINQKFIQGTYRTQNRCPQVSLMGLNAINVQIRQA
jgi:hypothetical protein